MAEIPCAVTTSRLVRFIPKIDSHGIMNMKGPKCVNTSTPARSPVKEAIMAAGSLSAPGTEYGPCEAECQHRDCAQTKRMASSPCRICNEQIGYDRGFFVEKSNPDDGPTVLVHSACAYREAGE